MVNPQTGPRAHRLRAGDRGDGPARVDRSEPAEHPGAHRGGPAHPRGVHRAARARDRCPPTTRRSSCASWRTCRRTRRCCARSRKAHDIHRATAAEIFGVPPPDVTSRPAPLHQGGELRPHLRHERVRPRAAARHRARRRRSSSSTSISRAIRASRDYMQRTRELARAQGYVETVFGRRLWLPDINARRRPAPRRAPSARRSTRRCRARRPISSSSR